MEERDVLKDLEFYKKIWKYIQPYKKRFLSLAIGTVFQAMITVILSIFWGIIIDEVVYVQEKKVFLWLMLFVGFLIILYIFYEFINTAAFWNTQLRFVLDLRMSVMKKVYAAKAHFFREISIGDIVYCVNLDTPVFMDVITDNIFAPISTLLTCVAVFCVLMIMNPSVNIFLVFAVGSMFGFSVILGKVTRRLAESIREKNGNLNSFTYGLIQGLDDIRTSNGQKGSFAFFQKKNREVYSMNKKLKMNQVLIEKINGLVSNLVTIGLFVLGVYLTEKSKMTVGVFVMSMTLASYITSRLIVLYDFYVLLQERKSNMQRVYEILKMQSEKEDTREKELVIREGRIKVEHLTFQFKNGFLLDDVSFEINKGENIAIVGRNGSGKSTLFNLLSSLYEPSNGRILFDDQDISECTYKSIRKAISVVQQEFFEQMTEINLSGGQIQQRTIEKALARDTKILLLDEAFSALDGSARAEMEDRIFESREESTIVITHNKDTVKKADRILVLDKGKVVAFDTHANLLQTCQIYVELFYEMEAMVNANE